MVGLLLPLISLSSLMHLCTGLKHMGKDLQLIYIMVLVLILWHLPDLHQLQPCSPQIHQCHEQFIFSAHEGNRFWEEG